MAHVSKMVPRSFKQNILPFHLFVTVSSAPVAGQINQQNRFHFKIVSAALERIKMPVCTG